MQDYYKAKVNLKFIHRHNKTVDLVCHAVPMFIVVYLMHTI